MSHSLLWSVQSSGVHHRIFIWTVSSRSIALTSYTGCNSPIGIGRASAHLFAANGAKALFLCDFIDQNLATHVREINSLYPACEVHARQFDASNEESVKYVVQEAVDKYGRLDIFFANAGIVGTPTVFTEIEEEGFMRTLKTNVFRCAQGSMSIPEC